MKRPLARRMSGAILVILGIATVVLLRPAPGVACSCVPSSLEDTVARAIEIFLVRVASAPVPRPTDAGSSQDGIALVTVELRIDETLRGRARPSIEVVTPRDAASCGFGFVPGEVYLLFTRERDGVATTDLCAGNRAGDAATEAATEVRSLLRAMSVEPNAMPALPIQTPAPAPTATAAPPPAPS